MYSTDFNVKGHQVDHGLTNPTHCLKGAPGTDFYATAVHLSMDKAGHHCSGPASSSPSGFYRNPGS
jgi:hypothetical protein